MKTYFRVLSEEDWNNGYLELLKQLTTVGEISKEMFRKTFQQIVKNGAKHQIWILCNQDKEIIGSGTILIEEKFIHNCCKVGHIEDIVVDNNYRGHGLGKKIINLLIAIAKGNECYKVILYCSNDYLNFYKKLGFDCKGIMMRQDLIL